MTSVCGETSNAVDDDDPSAYLQALEQAESFAKERRLSSSDHGVGRGPGPNFPDNSAPNLDGRNLVETGRRTGQGRRPSDGHSRVTSFTGPPDGQKRSTVNHSEGFPCGFMPANEAEVVDRGMRSDRAPSGRSWDLVPCPAGNQPLAQVPAFVNYACPLEPPPACTLSSAADFNSLQQSALEVLDSGDLVYMQGKPFIKKSGWRKIAFFFGVSFEIRDRTISMDPHGQVIRAEFVVRASMNGRFADAWGSCERGEKRFTKPSHDIPSTAETRAKSRACQDLLGIGEYKPQKR